MSYAHALEAALCRGRIDNRKRAQRDGGWQSAYDGQGRAEVPDDLQAALAASPRARAFFAALDGRNRYANVKKAETRARNVVKFVQMLARQEKTHS